MRNIALRHLAELSPATPEFDSLPPDASVAFLPLEAVWSDQQADHGRTALKSSVQQGYTRYREGDVVCPKVTPTFQAGRSMIARGLGAGSTELHILRPRQDVDSRWLSYAVRSKRFLDEGVSAFQGVAGLQRVPPEFVNSFKVADYNVDEQRRIADFLDDRVSRIDRIITARHEQIALTDQRFTSNLHEKLDGLPLVPLRRLAREILVGIVIQPAKIYSEGGNGIPALRGLNIKEGEFDLSELVRITPEGHMANPRSTLRVDDVVVVRTGAAGSAAVVPPEMVGWNCVDLVVIRPNNEAIPEYISWMLNASKRSTAVASASTGSIQQHFGVGAIAAHGVPRLTIPEQSKVVVQLDFWSAQNQLQQAQLIHSIDLLTEYKTSLITAAVTGELDVTTAGSNVPG